MERIFESEYGFKVKAYGKQEAACLIVERLRNQGVCPYRISFRCIKRGMIPLISRLTDGKKYGERKYYLVFHGMNVVEAPKTWNDNTYDCYDKKRLLEICRHIGYSEYDIPKLRVKNSTRHTSSPHRMLYLLDKNKESIKLYNQYRIIPLFAGNNDFYVRYVDGGVIIGSHANERSTVIKGSIVDTLLDNAVLDNAVLDNAVLDNVYGKNVIRHVRKTVSSSSELPTVGEVSYREKQLHEKFTSKIDAVKHIMQLEDEIGILKAHLTNKLTNT